jgi:hypothetical protein
MIVKVKLYSSLKDRGIGLIGHKKAEPAMFLTRFGIHTLGLKFPIDVLVLDSEGKVVKLEGGLKPNRFFVWPIKFNKVVELPEGYIKKNKIHLGSNIKIVYLNG